MPCYCDIPTKDDQATIEHRAKERMYFDACRILTEQQIASNKICLVPLPTANSALCELCKILTNEQMKSISAYYYLIEWRHETLYDWYMQHLKDDKENN